MSETEHLLPCPFCDGDPGYSVEGFVFCCQCACEGPTAPVEGEPGMARRDAVAAWNTRASPAPAASRAEPVRYARVHGTTLLEMRSFIVRHPLYQMGDAVLCWVNEGDLYSGSAREIAALPDAPVPAKDGEGEG